MLNPGDVSGSARRDERPARRSALCWLLALTVVAGLLRFHDLSRPPLWGDEAMTWTRICGSYSELLDVLRLDGFTPLHYQLLWWIKDGLAVPVPTGGVHWASLWSPGGASPWWDLRLPLPEVRPVRFVAGGIAPTPAMLRFVSALAGTLMVPAMYALALQMASRKAALAVAAFTCCSAYLLNYSRDAKMYMPAWLFVTIHVACFLWWVRLRGGRRYSRPAWYLWVASGLGMVGLHAATAVVLGIEAMIAFSLPGLRLGRARALRSLGATLLGILLIGSALAGYYGMGAPGDWYHLPGFNRWNLLHEPPAGTGMLHAGLPHGGLGWINDYNATRDLSGHLRYTLSAFMISWEWPHAEDGVRIDQRISLVLKSVLVALYGLVLIGLAMPRSHMRCPARCALAPIQRRLLMLAWLVLPMWFWWLLSRQNRPTDVGWWLWMLGLAGMIGLIGRQVLATPRTRVMRLARWLGPMAAVALIAGFLWLLLKDRGAGSGSIWIPRYLGFIWPAFAIAMVLLMLRLPAGIRVAAIVLLLGVNLTQYAARIYAGTEPPSDRIARDLVDARHPSTLTFLRVTPPAWGEGPVGLGAPGTGYPASFPTFYYAALYANDEWTPPQVRSFQWPFMRYAGPHGSPSSESDEQFARRIAVEAGASAQARRIVTWTSSDHLVVGGPQVAPGNGWQVAADETFMVRDHWTWQTFGLLRRTEYRREPDGGGPASGPSGATRFGSARIGS